MRRAVLASCLAVLPASAALAQQQLPDVVVTATRVPTLEQNIPAGVTVIDRKTIEQRGYTTLVDALSAVPGLRIVQSGGPGSVASVFMRGTDSNQVLVLRDGVPVNDPSDPNGAFNFGVDTLEDVDRIEVVRGPMSGLYGSAAIGGVINIITRKGSGPAHGSITLGAGLPRAMLGAANVSGSSGIWDYHASVESESQLGFDNTPQRETSVYTGERDGFRTRLGSLEVGVTPWAGTRFSALLRGQASVYGYDNVAFPAFDDPNETGRDNNFFGRVGGTSSLFDGTWQTGLFLGYSQDDRHYTNLLDPDDPNQASENSRYHGRATDLQWNNTVLLPDFGPSHDATLTFGTEYNSNSAEERLNSTTNGATYLANVNARDESGAGWLGLQTTLLQRLTLTGQMREEATSIAGNAFTWRIGGVLAVPEIWSHIKLSYGTAFLAPSLFDRYGIDSDGYVGNPNLLPERSQGWEIGWAVDVPAFGVKDYASLSVTYFNSQVTDLITTQFEPVFTTVNIGSAHLQGFETVLTLHPAPWLQADMSYTYTEALNVTDNTLLLRRPRNAAAIDLRATPTPRLAIAPELLYTGAFADEIVDDAGFPVGVGMAKAGLVLNMNVTYQYTPRAQLYVTARNIGNSNFEPASGYQIPGPSFIAGTRITF